MLLRNSRVPILLFGFLFIAIAFGALLATAQAPSPANSQSAQPTPTPSQDPAAKPAQTPSQPPQDSPPQNQKTESQENKESDSGVFVFKKEVEEVVVHATVMDDKNRLVTTLDKSAFTAFE